MKRTLAYLILIFVLSCNKNPQKTPIENLNTKSMENFDWLTGNWKRLNEEPGKETFEKWYKINENEYSGIGFTLKNNDTISQEKIQLLKSNGSWNLSVKTPDEKQPVKFKILSIKETPEFICGNDSIDFPKRIKYWFEANQLKAKISNDDMEIVFNFEKIQE